VPSRRGHEAARDVVGVGRVTEPKGNMILASDCAEERAAHR